MNYFSSDKISSLSEFKKSSSIYYLEFELLGSNWGIILIFILYYPWINLLLPSILEEFWFFKSNPYLESLNFICLFLISSYLKINKY